jgi:hypothetical protein
MFTRITCLLVVAAFFAATAAATGTVSLTLESASAGQNVAPGAAINWSIKASVSTGDNLGLALISTNLVQDPNNPALFDIPPGTAGSIPAAMNGFNRPGGITNPGEGGALSGYIGVQRGTAGAKNLIQIGGGQNTFGAAGSPFGTDFNVDGGIGQSAPQLIVSGTFNAPATVGTYTFRLQGAVANVLNTIGTPPAYSQVSPATVNLTGGTLTFTVASAPAVCHGDMNCDGKIDFGDINPFVQYLSSFASWQATYLNCNPLNGDINGDGTYGQASFGDINPFVALLSSAPLPITCP